MTDSFKEKFRQAVAETEAVVYSYLPEETGHQKTIFEAMNYSVKAGGKRLRPLLMQRKYTVYSAERTGDRAVHGGDGDDPHVLTDPR